VATVPFPQYGDFSPKMNVYLKQAKRYLQARLFPSLAHFHEVSRYVLKEINLMAQSLSKLDRETKGLKLFPLFTLIGWLAIMIAVLIGVLVLSPTASSYWGGNAKVARDMAVSGDSLLTQLATLQALPKILVPLAFLGVASFMTGIALEFASIPGILDRRIAVLKQAVPLMGGK
jgi:hypothetical protein